MHRAMDDSIKLENAYKAIASKKDDGGEMNGREDAYNRNSKEDVSKKDDLSPLPELLKQKSSDNMEGSRKKVNYESQTTNDNDDEWYGNNEYEHEYEDENYDND
jgi:hypothetical protein